MKKTRVIDRALTRAKEMQIEPESELARRLGLPHQANLTNWKSKGRDVPPKEYARVAAVLLCSVDALLGNEPMPPVQISATSGKSNIHTKIRESSAQIDHEPAVAQYQRVPLVTIEHAETAMLRGALDSEVQTIDLPAKPGLREVAVRYVGDALAVPSGSVFVIAHGLQPRHGDVVLARHPSNQLPIFRRYWLDGAVKYLKADTAAYPMLALGSDAVLLGVVTKTLLIHREDGP